MTEELVHQMKTFFINSSPYIMTAVVFGSIKATLRRERRSWKAHFVSISVALPVAVLAGFLAQDSGLTNAWQHLVVAISALTADYIVEAIVDVAAYYKENPRKLLKDIRKK